MLVTAGSAPNVTGIPSHDADTRKSTAGAGVMVMVCVRVLVQPALFSVVRLTLYGPWPLNTCCGFCMADVLFTPETGSPKFQLQLIIIFPPAACERSVNAVGIPLQLPSKLNAVEGASTMVMVLV